MQRFPRDKDLPHLFVDDSAWYLAHPGKKAHPFGIREAMRYPNGYTSFHPHLVALANSLYRSKYLFLKNKKSVISIHFKACCHGNSSTKCFCCEAWVVPCPTYMALWHFCGPAYLKPLWPLNVIFRVPICSRQHIRRAFSSLQWVPRISYHDRIGWSRGVYWMHW